MELREREAGHEAERDGDKAINTRKERIPLGHQ